MKNKISTMKNNNNNFKNNVKNNWNILEIKLLEKMPKPKIAVLYFPGNNCEEETRDRCIDVGMEARIIRWNSKENLSDYDGYIIPGGFSYEDRVRAGVIAAKDKIMEKIREEVDKGKLWLGICNGA